jgi:hypothetical protein
VSSWKWAIGTLGLVLGGCYYASDEKLFPTSDGDTLPIGSVVACVSQNPNGPQEMRYEVERFAYGEKSLYRFKGGLLNGPRLVAFHRIQASIWIYAAKSTSVGGPTSPYAYGVIRLNGNGVFEVMRHGGALRDRLAAIHGVKVKENVLIGAVINQERFLLALAAEPGAVGGSCMSK